MESLFIGGGFWRFGTDCTCQEFGGFWNMIFYPKFLWQLTEQVEWKRCLRGNPVRIMRLLQAIRVPGWRCFKILCFPLTTPPKWKGIFLQEVTFSVSTFQNDLCPAVLQGVKEITIKFPHHKIKHGYHCVYIYRCELNFGISSKKRFLKVSAELDLRDKDESLGMATKPL